jgi:membrane protease YdiL (CAAX protease family)
MAPVFVLGLCTAIAAERSRSLLAPMLAHGLYNAGMLALQ